MTELTATVVIESLLRATADDATPIIRRLARNQARVFLDSRAGGAGEGVERLKETAEDLRKIGWHKDRQNVLDAIASLSHGEGRK